MFQQPTFTVISIFFCADGYQPPYSIRESSFFSLKKAIQFIREEGQYLAETEYDEDWHWEEPHVWAFIIQENVPNDNLEPKKYARLLFNKYGELTTYDTDYYSPSTLPLPLKEEPRFQSGDPVLVYNPEKNLIETGVVINADNYFIATGINKAELYSPAEVIPPADKSNRLPPELNEIYKSFLPS